MIKGNKKIVLYWKERVKALNMLHDGIKILAERAEELTHLDDRQSAREMLRQLHRNLHVLDSLMDRRGK